MIPSSLTPKGLYKQIIFVGRDWPAGQEIVRRLAKKQFFQMRNETDPVKIQQGITKGEYIMKEMQALIRFHTYRTISKRYGQE